MLDPIAGQSKSSEIKSGEEDQKSTAAEPKDPFVQCLFLGLFQLHVSWHQSWFKSFATLQRKRQGKHERRLSRSVFNWFRHPAGLCHANIVWPGRGETGWKHECQKWWEGQTHSTKLHAWPNSGHQTIKTDCHCEVPGPPAETHDDKVQREFWKRFCTNKQYHVPHQVLFPHSQVQKPMKQQLMPFGSFPIKIIHPDPPKQLRQTRIFAFATKSLEAKEDSDSSSSSSSSSSSDSSSESEPTVKEVKVKELDPAMSSARARLEGMKRVAHTKKVAEYALRKMDASGSTSSTDSSDESSEDWIHWILSFDCYCNLWIQVLSHWPRSYHHWPPLYNLEN